MKKFLSSVLIAMAILGAGCTRSTAPESVPANEAVSDSEFGIYLVENNRLIVSEKDVLAYNSKSRSLKLTPDAVKKLHELNSFGPEGYPMVGGLIRKEFNVVLKGEELFRGAFWSMVMSSIYDGVVITDPLIVSTTHRLDISGSYPFNSGSVPNAEKLTAYFESIGKLER